MLGGTALCQAHEDWGGSGAEATRSGQAALLENWAAEEVTNFPPRLGRRITPAGSCVPAASRACRDPGPVGTWPQRASNWRGGRDATGRAGGRSRSGGRLSSCQTPIVSGSSPLGSALVTPEPGRGTHSGFHTSKARARKEKRTEPWPLGPPSLILTAALRGRESQPTLGRETGLGTRQLCSGGRGWDLNPDLSATVSELLPHSQRPHDHKRGQPRGRSKS